MGRHLHGLAPVRFFSLRFAGFFLSFFSSFSGSMTTDTHAASPLVRALHRSARVNGAAPPYDTLHVRILYPAEAPRTPEERNLGVLEVARARAPFPVVIFMNGINVGPEVYSWLGHRLVAEGYVFVTYTWVSQAIPGAEPGLTPGVDLDAVKPETWGTKPTASALPAIFDTLSGMNRDGALRGALDLDRIVLGGHSGGGTVAIQNADPKFFPQVKASFAYAAHTLAPMMQGFEKDAILKISGARPMLLLGGSRDGVMAASVSRYGGPSDRGGAIERTFREAFQPGPSGDRGDSFLALVEGANHFSFCDPLDSSQGRLFLDHPPTRQGAEVRHRLGDFTAHFLNAFVRNEAAAKTALEALARSAPNDPFYAAFARR